VEPRGPVAGKGAQLNAAHDDQLRLLDVQALDSKLDQLAHRRRGLPELAELERVGSDLTRDRDLLIAAETQESDLQREVTKAEADVTAVRDRSARDRSRMDSGSIGSAKELEALQHEVVSLARRQEELEEIELDAMERLETAQAQVASLRLQVTELTDRAADLEIRRDQAFADIDKDVAYVAGERERAASGLPGDLAALYEKLRADNGGVGAASLHRGRCEGCNLELTPVDLARFRSAPPEEVLRCEECRRILVRTPDSGL
jgi:uncharacterized protein